MVASSSEWSHVHGAEKAAVSGRRGVSEKSVENAPPAACKVSCDEGMLHYHSLLVWPAISDELVVDTAEGASWENYAFRESRAIRLMDGPPCEIKEKAKVWWVEGRCAADTERVVPVVRVVHRGKAPV